MGPSNFIIMFLIFGLVISIITLLGIKTVNMSDGNKSTSKKPSKDEWECPKCGLTMNITGVSRCLCGYDKNLAAKAKIKSVNTNNTQLGAEPHINAINTNPTLVDNQNTKVTTSSNINQQVQLPLSLIEKLKLSKIESRKMDEILHEVIFKEIRDGDIHEGLWLKAISDSKGNHNVVTSLYIQLRKQSLEDDIKVMDIALKH